MPNGKYSAAARVINVIKWAAVLALALPVTAVHAQSAVAVAAGNVTREAKAVEHEGAFLYPAALTEVFAGTVRTTGQTAVVRIFGDTVRFWSGSAFFRSGSRVYQLASPVAVLNGALHVPEQFFIQWLPARFPDSVGYRSGVVRRVGDVVAAAVSNRPTETDRPSPGPVGFFLGLGEDLPRRHGGTEMRKTRRRNIEERCF